jgi:transposase
MTIVKNNFINDYRKQKVWNAFLDYTPDLYFINSTKHSDEYNPEAVYEEKELLKVISSLRQHNQIPFQMYIDGYQYNEIAEKLNIPLGTIKSRIFLARKEAQDLIMNDKKITPMIKTEHTLTELILKFREKYQALRDVGMNDIAIRAQAQLSWPTVHKLLTEDPEKISLLDPVIEKVKAFLLLPTGPPEKKRKVRKIRKDKKVVEEKLDTVEPNNIPSVLYNPIFWDYMRKATETLPKGVVLSITVSVASETGR